MELFRLGDIPAKEVAAELGLSRRRVYDLRTDYLKAFAAGRADCWQPGSSGGNHKGVWPLDVCELLRHRLSTKPPSSYSFAASEALRLLNYRLDRSQVRMWAMANSLAHADKPVKKPRASTRRWQRQAIGELWQLDATPHSWFPGHQTIYPMLNMLDDCSRVFVGSSLYHQENLLAYLDFLPRAFLEYGLPLVVYVDHHSIFFPQHPEALTQLGTALQFYDVSFQYASTPQAKGKIERAHQYWQGRLPAFFAAHPAGGMEEANQAITQLRHHRNKQEQHRELGCCPQEAWDVACRESRSKLRPVKRDPWWSFVWALHRSIQVGDDGRIPIGTQRIRLEIPPRTRLVLCQHPGGYQSVIAKRPTKNERPVILFSNRPK